MALREGLPCGSFAGPELLVWSVRNRHGSPFRPGGSFEGAVYGRTGPELQIERGIRRRRRDYVDFPPARQHAADIEAVLTQLFGIIPLAIAAGLALYNRRIAMTIADACLRRHG